jgi:hypothetical protein
MLSSIADAAPQGESLPSMALAVAYAQLQDDTAMRRQLDNFAKIAKDAPVIDMLYIACVRTLVRQNRRDEALKLWENRASGGKADAGIALRYALEIGDDAQAAALAREKTAGARWNSSLTVARIAARSGRRELAESLAAEVEESLRAAPRQPASMNERYALDVARVRLACGDFKALLKAADAIDKPAQKAIAEAATALEVQIRRGAKVTNILVDGEYYPFSIEE